MADQYMEMYPTPSGIRETQIKTTQNGHYQGNNSSSWEGCGGRDQSTPTDPVTAGIGSEGPQGIKTEGTISAVFKFL